MFCLILTLQLTWLLSTIPDVQWCYVSGEKKKKKEKQRKSTLDYTLVVLIYCTTATIIER